MFDPLSTTDEPKAISIFSATDNNNLKANIEYNSCVRKLQSETLKCSFTSQIVQKCISVCCVISFAFGISSFRANRVSRFVHQAFIRDDYLRTKIELCWSRPFATIINNNKFLCILMNFWNI